MKTRKVMLVRRNRYSGGENCRTIEWRMSVPFAMSKVGKLVHRVRFAGSVMWQGQHSHDWVTYWCGNGTTSPVWLENPLDGRIVCENCEARAVAKGEPTTDSLAGKHVHKGVLIAHKTCCQEQN